MAIKEKLILNQTIVQQPGNLVSDMDGEKVMLNIQNGKYYNLGEVGGFIWELIAQPTGINSLILSIIENYEVNPSECEKEVISFCTELYLEGLIEVINN
ncbi:lasso peptide biosynthesis PqqD family chaperone [Mesobacillus jeotgali]|uniref:lasso peptide biosynthesis PqqD family chaperone n=1 Tax=Mesobacillus jeotgali TaxID=129985 RepID=UPI0009A6B21A|nr:lasso peptide biosynthesis PqqD family chaperone [Mesobacillus jeotgali]